MYRTDFRKLRVEIQDGNEAPVMDAGRPFAGAGSGVDLGQGSSACMGAKSPRIGAEALTGGSLEAGHQEPEECSGGLPRSPSL